MAGYDPNAELMSDLRDFRAEMTTERLEIMRLQAEVERLTDFIRHIGKVNGEMHGGMVDVARAEIAAAWNDAIEAAANEAANWWAYIHDDQDRDGPIAESIRALKRT